MKNKTIAVWLTLLAGPLGLHRIYLKGKFDSIAVALLFASATGMFGVLRLRAYGVDDQMSWLLLPWAGIAITVCALTAIFYGLMDTEKWNRHYNQALDPQAVAGQSNWLTVFGLATALFIGATAMLTTIAFTFQHYFEYQADQATASGKVGGKTGETAAPSATAMVTTAHTVVPVNWVATPSPLLKPKGYIRFDSKLT